MKCKREKNFAANRKYDRKENKKYGYHKKVNWYRAFMLMPWWVRWNLGKKTLEDMLYEENLL